MKAHRLVTGFLGANERASKSEGSSVADVCVIFCEILIFSKAVDDIVFGQALSQILLTRTTCSMLKLK